MFKSLVKGSLANIDAQAIYGRVDEEGGQYVPQLSLSFR